MFDNIITPLPGYNRKPVNTRNQKTLPMPVKILVSSYEAPRSQKKSLKIIILVSVLRK